MIIKGHDATVRNSRAQYGRGNWVTTLMTKKHALAPQRQVAVPIALADDGSILINYDKMLGGAHT